MEQEITLDPSTPSYVPMQINLTRISALMAERNVYMNIPKMQRSSNSWPRRKKQYFVESILRGIPVGSMIFHWDERLRGGKLWITDGLQRLSAIDGFMRGEFSTGRLRPGSPNFGVFEPNKKIHQLSSLALNQFKGYSLPLYIVETHDPEVIKFIFLSLQNAVQLTLGEKLYAQGFDSDSILAIEQVEENDYFSSMYIGGTENREVYMMAQFPLLLEIFNGFVNIDGERLRNLASDIYKDRIDNALLERIEENMLAVQHLFAGVQSSIKNELILQYQAVFLLRQAGIDPFNSDPGALVDWYKENVPAFKTTGKGSAFSTLSSQIHKHATQENFWQAHLSDFAKMPGLNVSPASATNLERIEMWMYRRHICPSCSETVGDIHRVNYHSFLPTDPACNSAGVKFVLAQEPERELIGAD